MNHPLGPAPRKTNPRHQLPLFVETLEGRICLAAAPFLPPQTFPTPVVTPRVLVTADLNNDGFPDVVAPLPSQGLIQIRLNDGIGGLEPATYIHFAAPHAVAAADFTNNGDTDIAVVGTSTTTVNANVVAIYFGDGTGQFNNTPVTYTIATSGQAIATADLNGDGFQDIVVTTAHRIAVLMNEGNGIFAQPVYYDIGASLTINDSPTALAVADLNHDGLPDIAVTLFGTGRVAVLMNNPADPGTFSAPSDYPVSLGASAITTGDFNGDGNVDLAVVSSGFRIRAINILLGNGDGTFGPAISYAGPPFADAIASADFTGNGKDDLVIDSFQGELEYLPGNGDGTFGQPIIVYGAPFAQDIQVADMNQDGIPDLVVPAQGIKIFFGSVVSSAVPGGPTEQSLGNGAANSYTFFAIDGTTTTVTLSGPGSATLDFSSSQPVTIQTAPNVNAQVLGQQLAAITLTNTTSKSTLTISTRNRGQTLFTGDISDDSPIGTINAPTTNLTGTLSLPAGANKVTLQSATGGAIALGASGISTLSLQTASGETLTSAGPIAKLAISQNASITLTAPSIGKFTVGRSLTGSTLNLTNPFASGSLDLTSLSVAQGMTGVALMSAGNIGSIAAQFMTNDTVYAGVGTLATGQTLPGASDFVANATINTVTLGRAVLVPSFENSVIAASIENTLRLGQIQTDNNGVPFGVAADHIGILTGVAREVGKSFTLKNLNSPRDVTAQEAAQNLSPGDFVVDIV